VDGDRGVEREQLGQDAARVGPGPDRVGAERVEGASPAENLDIGTAIATVFREGLDVEGLIELNAVASDLRPGPEVE
jgi:hypothetical protein